MKTFSLFRASSAFEWRADAKGMWNFNQETLSRHQEFQILCSFLASYSFLQNGEGISLLHGNTSVLSICIWFWNQAVVQEVRFSQQSIKLHVSLCNLGTRIMKELPRSTEHLQNHTDGRCRACRGIVFSWSIKFWPLLKIAYRTSWTNDMAKPVSLQLLGIGYARERGHYLTPMSR